MIKYMLDTNICIYLMNAQCVEINNKFDRHRKGEIVISSITWAELCCGKSENDHLVAIDELLLSLDVAPFDASSGRAYGMLTKKLPNRRANFDRLIAAHAIALEAILVTNNMADFRIYEPFGLKIENWINP